MRDIELKKGRNWRTALCVVCWMLASIAMAQETATAPGVTEKSASYYLPKTALHFALKIEGETYHPGQFCQFTEKYYHQVSQKKKKTTYNVVNLGISSIGVPDKSRLYTIQLLGKSKGANVVLSSEGQLLAFNDEPSVTEQHAPFVPAPKAPEKDLMSLLPASIREMQNDSQKVDLIVRYMFRMQENIQHLENGEPVDSTCTETLDQLKSKMKALETLFFGKTTRDTTEAILVITPDKEVDREVIFRLNQETGEVSRTAETGTPYRLTIKDMHSMPKQQYELSKENKKGCVYVLVPSRIRAIVYRDQQQMGQFDLYAGQFGFVDELSGSLFRNYKTHFRLSPVIGSVDKIKYDPK